MISKRFVKLGILVYYSGKYKVKMFLWFIVYPYFEKSLEEQVVEINNISESSLKLTFGLGNRRN